MRIQKRQLDRPELEELSLCVMDKLQRHPRFVASHTLLLYHSLPDEVCTHRLIDETKGKTVLLPRVTGAGTMELRVYTGRDDMREGAFHIMEPCGNVFMDYEKIDLAVVPGMAFDRAGNRLGRGKGYYDRLLPQIPQAYKIGVCFGFQLVDDVPVSETDVAMDEIIC